MTPMRIIIVGAGRGAELIIQWIRGRTPSIVDTPPMVIAGTIDDIVTTDVYDVPHLGRVADISRYTSANHSLIVSASSVPFRKYVWGKYADEYKFVTVNRSAWDTGRNIHVGDGNVIFPDVSCDTETVIGNNNVISAGCVVAHHNRIGDSNLFGPGCLFSGSVSIGSGCRFGSGIIVEPMVTIGDDVDIASGTVITSDVPSSSSIKARRLLGEPQFQGDRRYRKAVR